MNPKDKKSKRAHSVLLNEMQKSGNVHVGYDYAIATLLLIVGTIGISPEAFLMFPSRRALYLMAKTIGNPVPYRHHPSTVTWDSDSLLVRDKDSMNATIFYFQKLSTSQT